MCLKSCLILEVSEPPAKWSLDAVKNLPVSDLPKLPAAIRKISIKRGNPACCLVLSITLCRSSFRFQVMPILSQQALAKSHWKNRWAIVSSSLSAQRTQRLSGCTLKCLLTSMFLVLSLSKMMSHAKNLILGVTLHFQIRRKILGTCSLEKANLYSLAAANLLSPQQKIL